MAKNWQETVISPQHFSVATGIPMSLKYMYEAELPELEAQAKATWEARQKEVDEAEQRGIRKVTEFVNSHKLHAGNISIPKFLWQAFLKEHNIDN